MYELGPVSTVPLVVVVPASKPIVVSELGTKAASLCPDESPLLGRFLVRISHQLLKFLPEENCESVYLILTLSDRSTLKTRWKCSEMEDRRFLRG